MSLFYEESYVTNNQLMLPTFYLTEILEKCDFENIGELAFSALTSILGEIYKTLSGEQPHLTDLNQIEVF